MTELFLGISAFYHDSAAALLADGHIIAAAHEERFSRKKHDASFPARAVDYVLSEAGAELSDLAAIAFYDKPYIKFERLLDTYHAFAPRGLSSFLAAIPVWIKEKLFLRRMLWAELAQINGQPLVRKPPLLFPEHHLSHAASAFYPSSFDEAAILTIDGVGEWATTTIGQGEARQIQILKELAFPHSLGLLYSAFTYYCGFRVNSGEYKLMGLAPYGHAGSQRVERYKMRILDELVDLREDGSLLLNMAYFEYATGLRMCRDQKWQQLFELPPRVPESALDQPYMDLALAIQQVAEEIIMRLACTAQKLTGSRRLVMAGGVALNCVANGKLVRSGMFEDIWVQPAAGDAGGALGAALAAAHLWKMLPRNGAPAGSDQMQGSYLGPAFTAQDIRRLIQRYDAQAQHYQDFGRLCHEISGLLADGQIVGWFQGRMEWGPRALGNRSILGDARNPDMQKRLNLKIKYREGFRPFAPSVLEEDAQQLFECDRPSAYMQFVFPVRKTRCRAIPAELDQKEMYERLYQVRSDVPAVTHIDFSARIQTVSRADNPRYWQLINAFKQRTGYGLLVNTSFNVRGEPIVCTPKDAYLCFMRTDMDWLVMGDFVFDKRRQPRLEQDANWRELYELD